jgi:hypothetical protein
MNSIYVVDASVLILLSQHYPKGVFSSLWESIEDLIKVKNVLAPHQVFREIEQGGDDDLTKWCKANNRMFLNNTSDVIKFAQEIIQKYPDLVNPYATRETADPFLIALARSLKSNVTDSKPIIVTDENEVKIDRIPHISRIFGLESLKLTGMFQKEKWSF